MLKLLALYSKTVKSKEGNNKVWFILDEYIRPQKVQFIHIELLKKQGKIVNLDSNYNIITPYKNNQIVVLNKTTHNNYVVYNISEDKIYKISANEINNEPEKYFNIKIENNKIYLLNKLSSTPYKDDFISKVIKADDFNKKQQLMDKKLFDIVTLSNGMIELKKFNQACNLRTIIIPDFIDIIGSAFWSNDEIEHVILGKNVKRINKLAFYGCSNLKTIEFNENLELIDETAFDGCTSLKTLKFNDKLKKINREAFKNCVNLQEVYFGTKLNKIGEDAFLNCNKIKVFDLEHTKIKFIILDTIFTTNLEILKLPESLEELFIFGFNKDINKTKLKKLRLPLNYKKLKLNLGLGNKNEETKKRENIIITLNNPKLDPKFENKIKSYSEETIEMFYILLKYMQGDSRDILVNGGE